MNNTKNRTTNHYGEILEQIKLDPRYLANLDYGKPRSGHPEGTVRAHIAELEENVQALRPRLSDDDYWKLKILVHTHDSFKREAERGVPITHPKSHASLAAAFLASYCDDTDLQNMVQYHDEPYALYRQVEHGRNYSRERFSAMLDCIKDWNLFLAFNIVDGCTSGKERQPLYWLFEETAGKVTSSFTARDIL